MHPSTSDPFREPFASTASLLPAPWLVLEASSIAPAIVDSYRETLFEVALPEPCALRIGAANDVLVRWHALHRVKCSAFVTACNPGSEAFDGATNAARHRALGEELARRGLVFREGAGRHPSNGWPPEASWLAFGLAFADACELGRAWGQNAIVHAGADAVPRLVLLR